MVSQWHHQSRGLGSKMVSGAGARMMESTVLSAQATAGKVWLTVLLRAVRTSLEWATASVIATEEMKMAWQRKISKQFGCAQM